MSYSKSRTAGMQFEPIAGRYIRERLGLARVVSAGEASPACRQLMQALGKHPELSVGRNSSVEGFWAGGDGLPVIVEVTGSPVESRVPGLARTDSGRKLLGSAAQVAYTCRVENVPAPAYLIVTTALPRRGSSAAGWLSLLQPCDQGINPSRSARVTEHQRSCGLLVGAVVTQRSVRRNRHGSGTH